MTFIRLGSFLLPPPQIVHWNRGEPIAVNYTPIQKVAYCVTNFFAFIALLIASPATLAYDYLTTKEITLPALPLVEQGVHQDQGRTKIGFATSWFQTLGIGTSRSAVSGLRGRNDWEGLMDDPSNIAHESDFDFKDFFVDAVSNPSLYISMLKAHNVNAHRFSMEWSVIEPEPGVFDETAIALYRNFIQKLIEADITPSVTLSHFVVPKWFHESGGFTNSANIDLYVRYALKVMEQFPEVNEYWSFNELGVKAVQQVREVYPTDVPKGSPLSTRVHTAALSTMGMLISHCKLHAKVRACHRDKTLGVTHQWLRFGMASGNPLERVFKHLFESLGFWPVYNFFKTGRFAVQIPFMANVQFHVSPDEFTENGRFIQHLGAQLYPQPFIIMGPNHGLKYPGPPHAIHNIGPFSFGASCPPGQGLMRFGPAWNAEAIHQYLDEAFALCDEVSITEIGSDARFWKWGGTGFELDRNAQAEYLEKLFEQILLYSERTNRRLKAIFVWSDLRHQMEWENGREVVLSVVESEVSPERRFIGWSETPASQLIARIFAQDA